MNRENAKLALLTAILIVQTLTLLRVGSVPTGTADATGAGAATGLPLDVRIVDVATNPTSRSLNVSLSDPVTLSDTNGPVSVCIATLSFGHWLCQK
jgi:hypothetical protein